MLARGATCIANLLLAALAYLCAMPLRGLPMVAAFVGLALAVTVAADVALHWRADRSASR
jgi:hypothetical protein